MREGKAVQFEDDSQPGISCTEEQSAHPDADPAKESQEVAVWLPQLPSGGRTRRLWRGTHCSCQPERNDAFRNSYRWCAIEANRVYADKGSTSNANRQFLRRQKIKSAVMHRAYKNKPLSLRQKLANQLIGKKRYKKLYCRTVFRHNQTLIQNGTRQLLRHTKSQRSNHTKKHLHESEKSSQQNSFRPTIQESSSSKYCIRGKTPLKKGKKLHFLSK